MDAYLGEIRMFSGDFAPMDWMFCDGQILPISDYDALFAVLGAVYGGDGIQNFALPDLRGRAPLHGASTFGQNVGVEAVALSAAEIPAHTHTIRVVADTAIATDPTGNLLANAVAPPLMYSLASAGAATPLSGAALSTTTGGQAHANMMPSLCVNFIICTNGVFPNRN